MEQPDNSLVICPKCVHQFRAIPVEVQAEIETLRSRVVELEKDVDECPDCESLNRGYNHALDKLAACEKERDLYKDANAGKARHIESMHAENARLREALERILTYVPSSTVFAVAQAALAGESK